MTGFKGLSSGAQITDPGYSSALTVDSGFDIRVP
jgi:hypothetical protein